MSVSLAGGTLFAAALCTPGLALLLQHRRWPYRIALVASAGLLGTVVGLGGLFLGAYFLPAALCALFALGTETLTRRAV